MDIGKMTMESVREYISKYVSESREKEVDMNYITWDRRDMPDAEIGFTILSKNEYCGYRGETNEFMMMKMLESTNRNDWLMLIKNDYETSLWGFDKELGDNAISIIQKLHPLQDELGFVLCIKVVKRKTSTIESHIYNIIATDYWELVKKYFESPRPWYVFAIPQRNRIE